MESEEIEEFEWLYGSFSGGDPRDFSPDLDCCTQRELENHEIACKIADQLEKKGKNPNLPCPHEYVGFMHISITPFGIGSQKYKKNEN